jgi:MFS family permease
VRARASSLYVFVVALCGAALGPLLVALVTDYVLRDERRIGQSLAIVLAVATPAGSAILYMGRNTLQRILQLQEESATTGAATDELKPLTA